MILSQWKEGRKGKFRSLEVRRKYIALKKLLKQKFNDVITQVLKEFFSASDFMEAVRGRFCFYNVNARLRDSSYIVAQ